MQLCYGSSYGESTDGRDNAKQKANMKAMLKVFNQTPTLNIVVRTPFLNLPQMDTDRIQHVKNVNVYCNKGTVSTILSHMKHYFKTVETIGVYTKYSSLFAFQIAAFSNLKHVKLGFECESFILKEFGQDDLLGASPFFVDKGPNFESL